MKMSVHTVIILIGIFGASNCRQLPPGGIWSVDTEQTQNMNLDGIIFFHENQKNDKDNEGNKNNNNNNMKKASDDIKAIHTFSHFMPDQSKLSRTVGLSRAVKRSSSNMDDSFGNLPFLNRLSGSSSKRKDLFNFAPTNDVKAPSTSEVVGFDSDNQILKRFTGTGNEWNSGTMIGSDVKANDSVQQINFSQLGIMKENVRNSMNNNNNFEGINYLNVVSNELTPRNKLTNAKVVDNSFVSDSTGSSNQFDNFDTMQNSFDKSSYIFGSKFGNTDTSILKGSAKLTSNLVPKGDNKAQLNDLPKMPSSPRVANGGTIFSTVESAVNDNVFTKRERNDNIIKPFPFGQLQGNPAKTDKRVPTLRAKNDFVDHSRVPVLKVKSAFVDLSGRQNPNMKPLGTFVDLSNKVSPKTVITVKTTKTPTPTSPTTSAKTTVVQSPKPNPTSPEPVATRPGPMLTGLGLPGVVSVNPSPIASNANNAAGSSTTEISPGPKETVSIDNVNIPPEDSLKVDMLYPPAPFPVVDQSKVIANIDQTGSNQPNPSIAKVTDTQNASNDKVTRLGNGEPISNLDSTTVTGSVAGDITGTLDYDYDMYADVASDLTNNGQGTNSQNTQQTARGTGDNDHFRTDPNVQVINPTKKIDSNIQTMPNNQNTFISQTGQQSIGQFNNNPTNQQMFPNTGQNFANNIRVGPINNIQSNRNAGQIITNNGQAMGNNLVNQNQFRNRQIIQNTFPQSTLRSNNQFSSMNLIDNQNFMTQNRLNSNAINQLQRNMNNFPNDRNVLNNNAIQNDRISQNVIQNLSSGQSNTAINTGTPVSTDKLNARNELVNLNRQMQIPRNSQNQNISPVQIGLNSIPIINQPPFTSNNQNNAVNAQNSIGSSPSNQLAPSKIQTGTNIQKNPNQIQNNQINDARNPSAGQNTNNLNNQINQVSARPAERPLSNIGMANQISNQVNTNGINSLGRTNLNTGNMNNISPNRNFGIQQNSNTLNNNFQNGPIVSNGRPTILTSTTNNIPGNLNSFPGNGNQLTNTLNVGGMATNFQLRNNQADPQIRNNQMNAIGFRNGIQRIGQNNLNSAQNVLPNGQNVFLNNPQQLSFGNIPNNLRNAINNIPTFQGNIPQNQNNLPNNFLNGNFRNGLSNNFRPNMVPSSISVPGLNRFQGNIPFNTNQFGSNAINGRLRPFR